MRKIYKRKKGISLIEILISIAILAIISIPISGMILTSVKTNKQSEDKQKAALLGQQILEEIRSKTVDIKSDEIILSTGVKLSKSFDEENKKYSFNTTNSDENYNGFCANVTLEQYSDLGVDESKLKTNYDLEISIDKKNTNFIISVNDEEVEINELDNIKILITNNQEDIQLNINGVFIRVFNKKIDPKSGYINIKLNNGDLYSKLSIKIINNREDSMTLYLDNTNTKDNDNDKDNDTKNISIENLNGTIKRINNFTESDENIEERKGTMFEVKVSITKDSNKLFEGSSIKNIYIY